MKDFAPLGANSCLELLIRSEQRGKNENGRVASLESIPAKVVKRVHYIAELQIRGDIEGNSKIIFLIFQQKHML